MISKEIYKAFKDVLKASSVQLNFYWPAVDSGEPEKPYVEFEHIKSPRTSPTLKQEQSVRQEGSINLVICQEKNPEGGEESGSDLADELAELFPVGTLYNITGGQIEVGLADVRQGFATNSEWRTPLAIPYKARTSS